MSRRRRSRRPGDPQLAAAAVGAGLLLLAATGSVLTAGLVGMPSVAVHQHLEPRPVYARGTASYATDGTTTTVVFPVTPSAGRVQARVGEGGYADCATGDGTTWTCPVAGLTPEQAAAEPLLWFAAP